MKKLTHIRLFVPAVLLIYAFTGCVSEPVPSFTADQTTITEGGTVQFTDQSTNNPATWLWNFEGATPSASKEQNPLVSYAREGEYSVSLEVRNRGGSNLITKHNYITVKAPTTDLIFRNKTYTEVLITLGGIEKNIPAGQEVTYHEVVGKSVTFNAETSGTTAEGSILGVELGWSFSIELNGGVVTQDLNVGTDFFFLYITNNGTHVLSPLEINDGSAEIHTENVSVPADGVKYQIGYYHAWEETQVRGYYEDDPEYCTYWNHNEHFFFPNSINQCVNLSNSFKKSAWTGAVRSTGGVEAGHLLPAGPYMPEAVPVEGVIQYFAKRR
ncbi:MAG TPA: PKD domain-containing protein [Bacteroides sp.]|nr:PKD domain-containing protein [Bacteroides sp.]